MAVDGSGNLYIAEGPLGRVRKVSPGGTITTFAGDGQCVTTGKSKLCDPRGLALDGKGNLYIADYFGYRVHRVSPGGVMTTVAGTGQPGFSGDGAAATSAQLNYPWSVAVDGKGNVYIGDTNNSRVRKVAASATANDPCALLLAESQPLLHDRRPRPTRLLCVLPECEGSEERQDAPGRAAKGLSRHELPQPSS